MRSCCLFRTKITITFLTILALLLPVIIAAEEPSPVKVLLIADDLIGGNYTISDEQTASIAEILSSYGWDLTVAGMKDTLLPCPWSKENLNQQPLAVDKNILEIGNISKYNALIILPGGSYKNIVNDRRILNLIANADRQGLIIAAWCKGVEVLAAADVIKDKTVIGNFNFIDKYRNAGAYPVDYHMEIIDQKMYFYDVTPPIRDGRIITGVRSRYYRYQMCDLIKQAVDNKIAEAKIKLGINLESEPGWVSGTGFYPSGLSWCDINCDGWTDLVAANGLDMIAQPLVAYHNDHGNLPDTIEWQSDYKLPAGNIYAADFVGNGYPGILVSQLGFSEQGFPLGHHVLFANNDGEITREPTWLSPLANGFSCTGGDFNGDGRMDIVLGQGVNAVKPEDKKFQPAVIFFNDKGRFHLLPNWESDSNYLTNDVCAVDIDNDGDLDLTISGKGYGISVFYNERGNLESDPSWKTGSIIGARQMAFGDVDGDGFQDLAVAAPAPKFLSDGGMFYLFKNNNGQLENEPSWSCGLYKEPSCVAWIDIDNDGDLDLAAGGLNSDVGIFENNAGELSSEFAWSYKDEPNKFWAQQIAFCDFDQDYTTDQVTHLETDGTRKLFYIGPKNIQSIKAVIENDKPLDKNCYCCDLTEGWISLRDIPDKGAQLTVVYSVSKDCDMAVTALVKTVIFKNLNLD